MLYNLISLIALAAFVWVTYDVLINQKKMPGIKKAIWIVLAFFLSIIAAIAYYLLIKK